jgi:hypothetical protein
VVLDDGDQANALGYHDLSAERPPVDRILAAGDLKAGTPSTFTGSTEPREMLGGPNINLTGLVENSNTAGVLYAYEVCDSCEDDSGAIRSTMGWFRISPAASFRMQGRSQVPSPPGAGGFRVRLY